jgi:hypothetical protein
MAEPPDRLASENSLAIRRTTNDLPLAPEFQFLNFTEHRPLDAIDRLTVRVQAKRDSHRRKRLALNSHLPPNKIALSKPPGTGSLLRLRLAYGNFKPTSSQPQPKFITGCVSRCHVVARRSDSDQLGKQQLDVEETEDFDMKSTAINNADLQVPGLDLVLGELSKLKPILVSDSPRIRRVLHHGT